MAFPESIETETFYERYEDMSPDGRLRLIVEQDGDVIVVVHGHDIGGYPVMASCQFCTFSGGGSSPRTREALLNLIVAMQEDDRERPQYREGKG